MNEKLNLVKVLKDCPKGMELDCTMYENVTFVEVCKDTNTLYPIYCITTDENGNRSGCSFTKNGYASPRNSAKCVIFPKGKTTWEGFQRPFKDGDILYIDCNDNENTNEQYQYTFILKEISDGKIYCYCYIDEANIHKEFEICLLADMRYNPRLATKEEKQRLFDAIKTNGYKWNEETKTLDKLIVPKFKVGDIIRKKGDYICGIIKCIDIDNFYKVEYSGGAVSFVNVNYQNEYELVPDKLEKSIVPKFKVGDKIRHKSTGDVYKILFVLSNGYGGGVYDVSITNEIGKSIDVKEQDDYELVPNKFDPKTVQFQHFDKVLVSCNDEWFCDFFSHYDDTVNKFNCTCTGGCTYEYCIPYNDDTKHLIGKSIEDTPKFYRYWEEQI